MKSFAKFWLLPALLIFGGIVGVSRAASADPKHIIDVRTESEWNAGHLPGAVLIPYDQIKSRIGEVTKDKSAPIALYCRSGRRSAIALETLRGLGYSNVTNLGSLQEAQRKLGGSR